MANSQCQGPGPLSKVARGTPIPLAKGDNGDDITPLPSAAMILVKPTPPLLEGKPTPPVGSSLNSTPWKNSPTGYQFGRKRGIPKARGRTIGSSSRNIQKSSVVFAVIGLLVVYNLCSSLRQLNAVVQHAPAFMQSEAENKLSTTSVEGGIGKSKTRIAILSSFVPPKGANPPVRMKENYFDHIINKACYSYIWGYDFIFNMTHGFDESYPKWHWLNFGHWNKVKHLQSRIEEYDYIFYTDTDFLIQDIMRPVESFLHEFELYNKTNVHLFLPQDKFDEYPREFLFSNFAFLMRNSKFSLDILKYWDDFARGMCPRGNLNLTSDGQYKWYDSDQPGLWYAMMRTYTEHFPDRVPANNYPQCNETTGTIPMHSPPWNTYFQNIANLTKGSSGEDLKAVPDDQPYIFSNKPGALRSGMALNLNWGISPDTEEMTKYSYAFHLKDNSRLPPIVNEELERCKSKYGCYAHYDKSGEIRIGCGDRVYA